VEPTREFFVSNPARQDYPKAAESLRPVSGGGFLTGVDHDCGRRPAARGERLSDSEAKRSPPNPERRGRKRSGGGEVGDALRKAYDAALREDIPPDMLDLLGKLD
jgi:hypothetical protein